MQNAAQRLPCGRGRPRRCRHLSTLPWRIEGRSAPRIFGGRIRTSPHPFRNDFAKIINSSHWPVINALMKCYILSGIECTHLKVFLLRCGKCQRVLITVSGRHGGGVVPFRSQWRRRRHGGRGVVGVGVGAALLHAALGTGASWRWHVDGWTSAATRRRPWSQRSKKLRTGDLEDEDCWPCPRPACFKAYKFFSQFKSFLPASRTQLRLKYFFGCLGTATRQVVLLANHDSGLADSS